MRKPNTSIKHLHPKGITKPPSFEGEFHTDPIHLSLYSTDASAYRAIPSAVAYPKHEQDLQTLVIWASEDNMPLIPRTAGTSLAGQVVGNGVVVDLSRHMTAILEFNPIEKWVIVQPGVILDELNLHIASEGLFFGPETSTSNRCMMGGMVGNNSCGAHSIIYGSTRDHLLEVKAILSDGSIVKFSALSIDEWNEKCNGATLENQLYASIHDILSSPENQESIRREFPDPSIHRRNTGYAIDLLLNMAPFTKGGPDFNFCALLAGSEGTLALITEIKLQLVSLPPAEKGIMAVHFSDMPSVFKANLVALQFQPGAIELMDSTILELTKGNLEQQKNRFFLKGDPEALLIIEFARESREEIESIAAALKTALRDQNLGYHYPLIFGSDINKVWNLRKSGLGILSNMEGDAKPVSLIEDTAIPVEQLAAYIGEFNELLASYELSCVYHAHIGSGELHTRPILNLKNPRDVAIFRELGAATARLVKKYRGSLSGEHGDGRLRGEFLPIMIGQHNYELLLKIKQIWDPQGIFNPGKITSTPTMNTSLRYQPGESTRKIKTWFDFSKEQGIIRAAEKCNGSGDCRKTEITGGLMCPSYMATRNETDTTRARANILREYLTHSTRKNPFDHHEIAQVMELCLSCKGCRSECPSNVDITRLKAEFQQHYYDANGIPFRTRMIAELDKWYQLGSKLPLITNFVLRQTIFKQIMGFDVKRNLPLIANETVEKWYRRHYLSVQSEQITRPHSTIYLFNDEFTNYQDAKVGIIGIQLLVRLGYHVLIPQHLASGRTYLSKGWLRKAKTIAEKNVMLLKDLVTEERPLIGIEPSALLSFRDEYPALVRDDLKQEANQLSKNVLLIDEFLAREFKAGKFSASLFNDELKSIRLHGHCHQKALTSSVSTLEMLSIPPNYTVSEIPSGCCGMAGAFGYEKEHSNLSLQIGELILFKALRKEAPETMVAAPGTSCRHQISDGTGKSALHPVEILYAALKK